MRNLRCDMRYAASKSAFSAFQLKLLLVIASTCDACEEIIVTRHCVVVRIKQLTSILAAAVLE